MEAGTQSVSIVIPAYNSSKFISRTIESVLRQTYKNWELVVVDDGSKDSTGEIVKSFCEKDSRVKYIFQENSGSPSGPTNRGIENSSGEYVAILQHDDEWEPTKLEEQLKLMTGDNNLGFVACNAIFVNELKGIESESKLKISDDKHFLEKILCSNIIPYPSAVLAKRSVFDKVGYFDERFKMADDWDMWIRFVASGVNFAFIDKPLFKYHIYGGNITKTIVAEKTIKDMEYLLDKHKSLYDKFPKSRSRLLSYLGKLYADSGNMITSRRILKKSLNLDRYNTKAYVVFLLTLFGKNFYLSVLKIVRSLEN